MARTRYVQSKYAQAEAISSEALAGSRRTMGPDHPQTLDTMTEPTAKNSEPGCALFRVPQA